VGDYSVIEGGANVILPYSHVNSETKWSKKNKKKSGASGEKQVVVKDPSGKEIHSKFSVKNGQPLVQFTPKVPGP